MLTYYEMLEKTPKYWTRIKYTQFGNSMRSLALLRWLLAGGKISGSRRCVLRPVGALEDRFLVIGILPCFLDLTYYVSSIGNWIVLGCAGFCPCEIWRCGCFEMICRIGASPGFHQNIWIILSYFYYCCYSCCYHYYYYLIPLVIIIV